MYGVYDGHVLRDEQYLIVEIGQLWQMHRCYDTEMKADRFRQRAVGNTLGQLLYAMKSTLAAPGKNGKWSAWLKEQKIPRSTADRLVSGYAIAFNLRLESPHEAIRLVAQDVVVSKVSADIWPRIEKRLSNPSDIYSLLGCLAGRAGLHIRFCNEGMLVHDPDRVPEPTPASASTTDFNDDIGL
jgi:hypothetical protein